MGERCNAVVVRNSDDVITLAFGDQCKRAAVAGQFCAQHAAMDAAGKVVPIYEWRPAPEDSAQ